MKILIAYDGSVDADGALYDLQLAGLPAKAEALILSVAVPWIINTPYGNPGFEVWTAITADNAAILEKREKALAEDQVKCAGRFLKSIFPKWKVKTETTMDFAAKGILARAEKWKPDLIVLGSHGRSGMDRLLLGSVSQKVLHQAHATVRISRGRVDTKKHPPSLVVGIDGSRDSAFALKKIAARNWPKGTRIRLVAAMPGGADLDYIYGRKKGTAATKKANPATALLERKVLAAAAVLATHNLRVTTRIIPGDPREILLREAEDCVADAIFLGTRGLGTVKRLLLGGVSSSVATHAHCTVEIVRPKSNR